MSIALIVRDGHLVSVEPTELPEGARIEAETLKYDDAPTFPKVDVGSSGDANWLDGFFAEIDAILPERRPSRLALGRKLLEDLSEEERAEYAVFDRDEIYDRSTA